MRWLVLIWNDGKSKPVLVLEGGRAVLKRERSWAALERDGGSSCPSIAACACCARIDVSDVGVLGWREDDEAWPHQAVQVCGCATCVVQQGWELLRAGWKRARTCAPVHRNTRCPTQPAKRHRWDMTWELAIQKSWAAANGKEKSDVGATGEEFRLA